MITNEPGPRKARAWANGLADQKSAELAELPYMVAMARALLDLYAHMLPDLTMDQMIRVMACVTHECQLRDDELGICAYSAAAVIAYNRAYEPTRNPA